MDLKPGLTVFKSHGLCTPPNYLLRMIGLEDIYGVISEKAGRKGEKGQSHVLCVFVSGPGLSFSHTSRPTCQVMVHFMYGPG